MSRPTNVGYEKTRYQYGDGVVDYRAARVKNGRVTEWSSTFVTEKEADAWIKAQRELDEGDYQRSRG